MANKWNSICTKKRKRTRNRKLHITNLWEYLLKWSRPNDKTQTKNKILCEISLDDSIIIVQTKEEAQKCLKEIIKFLEENLELKLNKKTQIFKSKQGVNFCGYKINEYRMKIRDKGKRKLKKKIKYLKHQIRNGRMTTKEASKYLSGHLGYIKIANVKTLEDKLFYRDKS